MFYLKKRILQTILGFIFLKFSINTFPSVEQFSTEAVMHSLVFEPFTWFNSLIFFIIGFFVISRLIRDVLISIRFKPNMMKEIKWLVILLIGFIYIAFSQVLVAIAALIFSCFYAAMDSNFFNNLRNYNN